MPETEYPELNTEQEFTLAINRAQITKAIAKAIDSAHDERRRCELADFEPIVDVVIEMLKAAARRDKWMQQQLKNHWGL